MSTFAPRPPRRKPGTADPARPNPTARPDRSGSSILDRGGPAILDLQHTIGHQAVRRMLQSEDGPPAARTMADWLPQTRGTVAGKVAVQAASPVADRDGANAVTLGPAVHLSAALSRVAAAEQQRVLAHEAVHVAQQSAPGPAASRQTLETEADQLTSQVLSGGAVQPRFHADPGMALADDGGPLPGDRIAVEKAKKRRQVLLRFKAVFDGSPEFAKERQKMLDKRQRLDDSMLSRMQEIEKRSGQKGRTVEEYREQERIHLAKLNRQPITLEVTKVAVRIWARFQVRFEDSRAETSFPLLKQNLERGIRDTWTQTLSSFLSGRRFEVIPYIELVASNAPRDRNYWLVTVRPTDSGPMVYGDKSLGKAYSGPTAATDPTVDGGVMSIPPVVIKKPNVLGHETLHLFGLVDRYATLPPELTPTGKFEDVPLRDTRDRTDPLGEAEGTILEEDLVFLLDELGVFPNMTQNQVLTQLDEVEKIIATGRDPKSMIKKRTDFRDQTIKQAEDLD
jgi:hypothetical protein